jgi:hypothetical protein
MPASVCFTLTMEDVRMPASVKNVFNKCVINLNFAPIKGSVLSIFSKKSQIRRTLLWFIGLT